MITPKEFASEEEALQYLTRHEEMCRDSNSLASRTMSRVIRAMLAQGIAPTVVYLTVVSEINLAAGDKARYGRE